MTRPASPRVPSRLPTRRLPLTRRRFVARLFAWHATRDRHLLVRDAATAWEVLVAEVMSHQTGIERVGPYWRRFVDTWPTPTALADAPTRDLLGAWSGLGYNRRALALRETARLIASEHGGSVPRRVSELERLPGIGPYTARAVAATAFGTPVAPLDVNVSRVVGRVAGIERGSRDLQPAADALVARGHARRWLNAVMDLAERVCTLRKPACDVCPVFSMCATRGTNGTGELAGGVTADATGDVPAAGRLAQAPFRHTTRWLRGRLVAVLTDVPAGTWLPLPDAVGTHDRHAVAEAAAALEREGFVELDGGRLRLRP